MANQVLYGFTNMTELANERVVGNLIPVVGTAIDVTLAEHTRQLNALNALFVKATTLYKTRYKTPSAARLQPLDDSGRARPILPSGNYDLAFPIQAGGGAWGADYITQVKMTVDEAMRITKTLMDADVRWVRDHLLAALFMNTDWTFSDKEYGDLTVKSLANGDSTNYLVTSGSDAGTTATNQGAQAAGIADATNPFPTIYSELTKHPENSGEVISFIPTNLVATTEALATFHPISDPAVQVGASTAQLVGNLSVSTPGVLRGRADKCWIVEWRSLPDNYIISTTTGGEPSLAMREHPEAELQGFKKVAERNDYPFFESQYVRRAGFGAWNRVGAYITLIGSASYSVPTNYQNHGD
jgi:hypothetical protein